MWYFIRAHQNYIVHKMNCRIGLNRFPRNSIKIATSPWKSWCQCYRLVEKPIGDWSVVITWAASKIPRSQCRGSRQSLPGPHWIVRVQFLERRISLLFSLFPILTPVTHFNATFKNYSIQVIIGHFAYNLFKKCCFYPRLSYTHAPLWYRELKCFTAERENVLGNDANWYFLVCK